MKEEQKPLPHTKETILQLAIEGLLKGYPSSELSLELSKAAPDVLQDDIDKAIKEAIVVIRDTTLTDIDKIIPLHTEFYERIYREFEEMRYVPGKLKAMKAKERLLGLLKETNYVEIHNELNVEIEKEPEYDVNKLSPSEQGRLEALMKKVVRQ